MQNHNTVLYMDLKGKMNTSNVPDLPNKLFSFVCVTTIWLRAWGGHLSFISRYWNFLTINQG